MNAILYSLIFSGIICSHSLSSQNLSATCTPPFGVAGPFDATLPNTPYPVIFESEMVTELMSDGFEGRDKEYGDVNGDNLIDILYTTNVNELWFIPNTGSATNPQFFFDSRIFTGFVGIFSFRLMDWYADGVNDLVTLEQVPGSAATITLYLNIQAQIGFPAPIAVLIDGDSVPINPNQFIEVGDIDGDQFPDILVSGQGEINGTALFRFLGTGWAFPPTFDLIAPQVFDAPMIPEFGGSAPVPELYDADCDGDLDLFISDPLLDEGAGGHVDYYENTGQGSAFIYFTLVSPNPYGLDDIPLPETILSCNTIITRFADLFGYGCPEAFAHNPCHGNIYYYTNQCSSSCDASFAITGNEFCNTFQFINNSTGNGLSYAWNFDDPPSGINNTSTLFEPSHIFTACGLYNVCLRITGDGCEDEFCLLVNVTDPIPPVALCLGISMILDSNCLVTALPGFVDGGSIDNCQLTSLSLSPNTFNHCGFFPVTLTATDWCGNTSTCMTDIQVASFEPTTITCPGNKVLTSTSPNCTLVVNGLKWTGVTGSCVTATITYSVTGASTYSGSGDASGLVFNEGISIVTYTIRDDCGNIEMCSFQVKVNCACECPNNLLKNPGFYEGAVPGDLPTVGRSDHWFKGTNTPQVINYDSCCDAYSIQMWGHLTGGESIAQDGIQILAGHKYKISFCAKYLPSNPIAGNVQFGFTASSTQYFPNPYTCTTCQNVGSSPQIYNTNWAAYTLPIWTATQNWDRLMIRVYNSMGIQTWGRIDNICVEEVLYECCSDQERFAENIQNAVNITVDERTEEIVFSIGEIPVCDSIAYIDWGDGTVTEGPFGGNVVRRNKLLDHLLARVQFKAQEFDQSDTIHPVCLEVILSDSVQATLPSTKYSVLQKKCGKIKELEKKIEWSGRIANTDKGGRSEVSLSRYHLQAAVLKPIVYNDPLVRISPARGFTVVATQAGEEVVFFPNENISTKIQLLSPAPEGYEWYGLQSNLLTPTSSPEPDSLPFIISFTFLDIPEGSEDSTGAVWISDDKDDLYGEYILDAFAYFDTARTTYSTEYGIRNLFNCKITSYDPLTFHWKFHDWWRDSGGRDLTDRPYHIQTALLKATVLPAPAISLTNPFGNPLMNQAGQEILLTPHAGVTAKIQREYPAPAGYEWYGLQSNLLTPTNSPTPDSLNFRLEFHWIDAPEGSEDSTGAFWMSDDKDDLYGEFITDWFTLLGPAIIDTTTSVNHATLNDNIHLFPNPTSGKITVNWEEMTQEQISISIMDCYGRLQKAIPLTHHKNQLTMDVSELSAGIYFMKIFSKGKFERALKFIKT